MITLIAFFEAIIKNGSGGKLYRSKILISGLSWFVCRLLFVNLMYRLLRVFRSKDLNLHMRQFGVFRDSIPAVLLSSILEQGFSDENCPIGLVDVGANYGLFFRQTDFFKEQHVLAFEPNKFLHQNYGSNFKWEEKAVSDKQGVLEFYIDKNHTGGSSLIQTSSHNEIAKVSVCSLDEFITEDMRVDAIKIDVEGSELEVLQGAVGVIFTRSPLLMVESSASNINRIAKLLPDYSFYEINTPGLDFDANVLRRVVSLIKLFISGPCELLKLGLEETEERYIDNILCVPHSFKMPIDIKVSL